MAGRERQLCAQVGRRRLRGHDPNADIADREAAGRGCACVREKGFEVRSRYPIDVFRGLNQFGNEFHAAREGWAGLLPLSAQEGCAG